MACEHSKLAVVDTIEDSGDLIVVCKSCKQGWIVPIEAEGVSVQITKSSLQNGCKECRQYVWAQLRDMSPDTLDYTCPACSHEWHLHKSTETTEEPGSQLVQ